MRRERAPYILAAVCVILWAGCVERERVVAAGTSGGSRIGSPSSLGSRFRIESGSFKHLLIGSSKEATVRSCLAHGEEIAAPLPRVDLVVRVGGDFGELRGSESIILGFGDVHVAFDNDHVSSVWTSPSLASVRSQLRSGMSFDEVVSVLPSVMTSIGVDTARNGVRMEPIDLRDALLDPNHRFWKYDRWSTSWIDSDGYFKLDLSFNEGVLTTIDVFHSSGLL